MKQIALPAGFDGSGPLELRGGEFHHLARVRRLRAGARLRGRTPEGRAFDLLVAEVGRASLTVTAIAPAADGPAASWDITLYQCLPKASKLDQIVRQAVEAGVSRIVPVDSERSVARGGDWSGRLERLRRIAREAMQQCGARSLAAIGEPTALGSLAPAAGRVALFLHERTLAAPTTLERPEAFVYSPRPVGRQVAPAAVPPSLHECLAGAAAGVDLLVGPEGGLSEAEVVRLVRAGFFPVYLGETVLRVETAAIFALGAIKTLLLERDRWTVPRPR